MYDSGRLEYSVEYFPILDNIKVSLIFVGFCNKNMY